MDEMSNFDFVPIRDEIYIARKNAGITQEELAERCQKLGESIRQKDISEYEGGRANPTLEKLEIISRALGLNWRLTK